MGGEINSTSGWMVLWQGAVISWGSRKQDSVALSSCEAEIVALSECTKDVIYYRKKLSGLNSSYLSGPTSTATDNKGAHDLSYNTPSTIPNPSTSRVAISTCATW